MSNEIYIAVGSFAKSGGKKHCHLPGVRVTVKVLGVSFEVVEISDRSRFLGNQIREELKDCTEFWVIPAIADESKGTDSAGRGFRQEEFLKYND